MANTVQTVQSSVTYYPLDNLNDASALSCKVGIFLSNKVPKNYLSSNPRKYPYYRIRWDVEKVTQDHHEKVCLQCGGNGGHCICDVVKLKSKIQKLKTKKTNLQVKVRAMDEKHGKLNSKYIELLETLTKK